MQLLLLLLLLVPWGVRTASGVALPPAGVFRYVRCPDSQGWVGTPEVGSDPKRKGNGDPEKGTETQREDRHEGWGEKYKKIVRKASRGLKGIKVEMHSFFEQRLLGSWSVPDRALSPGGGPVQQTQSPHSGNSETGELRDRDQTEEKNQGNRERATPQTVQ